MTTVETPQKPLKGRRLQIAAGQAGLPARDVLAHRERWASQGYELPPISTPLSEAGDAVARGAIRLGDRVESALALVGVTQTRVARWLGSCGGCSDRKRKLNRLSDWAESVTAETAAAARQKLQGLLR